MPFSDRHLTLSYLLNDAGFPDEREQIIRMFKEDANNAVVLGGDLHNAFAWVLNEKGGPDGTPVAVNFGTNSVTSPGLLDAISGFIDPSEIIGIVGGRSKFAEMFENGLLRVNPSLRYTDMNNSGFIALEVTKVRYLTTVFGYTNSFWFR